MAGGQGIEAEALSDEDALALHGVSLDDSHEADLPSVSAGPSQKTTVRLSPLNRTRAEKLREHYGVGSLSDVVNIAIASASSGLKPTS